MKTEKNKRKRKPGKSALGLFFQNKVKSTIYIEDVAGGVKVLIQ